MPSSKLTTPMTSDDWRLKRRQCPIIQVLPPFSMVSKTVEDKYLKGKNRDLKQKEKTTSRSHGGFEMLLLKNHDEKNMCGSLWKAIRSYFSRKSTICVDALYFLLEKMDFNCCKRESARVYSITWREVANYQTRITNQHEMQICVSKSISGPQRTKKTGSQLPISGICGKSNGSPQFWPTYPHLSFPYPQAKRDNCKIWIFSNRPPHCSPAC